jgi:small multidrug resistance pump
LVLFACAIVFEAVGTNTMKLSEGFTKIVPSILLFLSYAASFVALAFAIKKIEDGSIV